MIYLIIAVVVIIVVGALMFAQKVAQKEQKKRMLMSRSKRLLQHIEDVWDTITQAKQHIKDTNVIDTLIKYYSYCVKQREQLLPQPDTAGLLSKAEALQKQPRSNDIIIELSSDSEIKLCKQSFSKSQKILKACASKSLINKQQYKDMAENLKFTILQLEVGAYERLGDAAGENKNPAVATNHYKYAKKLLIESSINFDNKHERIREITKKNQLLFGNIVKDKIEQQIEEENAVDEFGFPSDLNVMSGNARKD